MIFCDYVLKPAIIFVYCLLLVAVLVASYALHQVVIKKALKFLDDVYEDKTILEDEKISNFKLYVYTLIGFHYAHPISLDFTIFKHITDREPDNALYWVTYGKFAAIYPDLSEMHNFIVRTIINRKLKGNGVSQCIAQSHIIFQQRETNLTADLKKKLTKVSKDVSSCKRRLRHIWDQVIQGNIAEMDGAIASAYKAIQNTDAEFSLLLSQLPNNRFLYRNYSLYLYDVSNNFEKFQETTDIIKSLTRGIRVHSDHTQELGFAAFPNLPSELSNSVSITGTNEFSENIMAFDENIDEETVNKRVEENRVLNDLIDTLRIPSLHLTIILMTVVVIFITIASIACLSLEKTYQKDVQRPKVLLDAIDYAKYFSTAATAMTHLYLMRALNVIPFDDYPLQNFNGETTLKGQINYAISEVLNQIKQFAQFRNYHTNTKYFDAVNEILFTDSSYYVIFNKYMTNTTSKYSVIDVLDILALRLSEVMQLNDSEINRMTPLSPSMRNPFYNILEIITQMNYACENITDYVDNFITKANKYYLITMIALAIILVIILLIIMYVVWSHITKDKTTIYTTLMVLPKNVVSQISESLRSVKSDTTTKVTGTSLVSTENDSNRQEENLLKVLTAATDESSHSRELVSLTISLVIIMISSVVIDVNQSEFYMKKGSMMNENSQHIDNIMSTAAYINMMTMNAVDLAAILTYGVVTDVTTVDATVIGTKFKRFEVYNDKLEYYYSNMRFGFNKGNPFPDFMEIVNKSKQTNKCNESKVFASLNDGIGCISPDIWIRFAYFNLHSIVDPKIVAMATNASVIPPIKIEELPEAIKLNIFKIFDDFLYPASEVIGNKVQDLIDQELPKTIAILCAFLVIMIICYFIALSLTNRIEKKMKFTLRLLSSCQTQMVMQNTYIVSVLTGNFKQCNTDSSTRDAAFYDNLVEELPDAIIVTHGNDYTVKNINKAAKSLFGEDIQGHSFNDFMNTPTNFQPESNTKLKKLFDATAKSSVCGVQYLKGDTDQQFLSVIRTAGFSGETVVFTVRNVTQTFMYNKLITEERSKSDKLLSSILPASLVPRVQSGEKNISFSVPSATVVFIDIVEFTPWCGSNTAEVVTGTLNDIFTEFDTIISTLPVMERVKCIGDCYMAAGGIFAETPNVLQFARSSVDFGLEAIEAIGRVNERHGMKLAVRVGIHIGGPIVAGVIGTGKPTFEIFGPAISMAQQMEHNGVPMKVHVSRAVYELIYGGTYKIEERGEILTKHGKVVTYLVDKQP